MKKKIMSIVLTLILVLAIVPVSVSAAAPSDWAREGVEQAVDLGIVPPALQSNYQQTVTRAEFCALAVALYENIKGEITGRKTFIDTKDVNVEKAAAIGVVSGTNTEGTIFSPDAQLTREMAAVMLSRLATAADNMLQEHTATFADNASMSSWAVADIGKVQAAGIMGDTGNNNFSPKGSYTREQSIVTIIRLYDVLNVVPKSTLSQGLYTIQSLDGGYLLSTNYWYHDSLKSNGAKADYYWHLREAENGAYHVYTKNVNTERLVNLNGGDIEGNQIIIWVSDQRFINGQTWFFIPNDDGTYQIRTAHESGRVLTGNGGELPTLQTYTGTNSQKWKIEQVATNDEAVQIGYKQLVEEVNGFDSIEDIAIFNADGETDKSLKALISASPKKEILVEGKYVVVHWPDDIWAKYDDPKKIVDCIDDMWITQLELLGGEVIYDNKYKLLFMTDYKPMAGYMYASWRVCAMGPGAANDVANAWAEHHDLHPAWAGAIGHEIAHIMVGEAMNLITNDYVHESWANFLPAYVYEKRGLGDVNRKLTIPGFSLYDAGNGKYRKYDGIDYDKLSDSQRSSDILKVNTHLFNKFLWILVDNHGWDGMRTFLAKAAKDVANGVTASEELQGQVDYLILNLSQSYDMDLSALFEHWKLSPSKQVKDALADLPKEKIIAASYGLK